MSEGIRLIRGCELSAPFALVLRIALFRTGGLDDGILVNVTEIDLFIGVSRTLRVDVDLRLVRRSLEVRPADPFHVILNFRIIIVTRSHCVGFARSDNARRNVGGQFIYSNAAFVRE